MRCSSGRTRLGMRRFPYRLTVDLHIILDGVWPLVRRPSGARHHPAPCRRLAARDLQSAAKNTGMFNVSDDERLWPVSRPSMRRSDPLRNRMLPGRRGGFSMLRFPCRAKSMTAKREPAHLANIHCVERRVARLIVRTRYHSPLRLLRVAASCVDALPRKQPVHHVLPSG